MIAREDVIQIGRLHKPHGIAGELGMSFTNDVFDSEGIDCWLVDIDGILVPFFPESYRFRSDSTLLVKFDDVNDEKQAKQLSERDVFLLKKGLPEMEEELVWQHLVGYQVYDVNADRMLGIVSAVDDSTANVLLEVTDGENRLILPAAEELIEELSFDERTLSMRLPEGLADINL